MVCPASMPTGNSSILSSHVKSLLEKYAHMDIDEGEFFELIGAEIDEVEKWELQWVLARQVASLLGEDVVDELRELPLIVLWLLKKELERDVRVRLR